jgi:carbamoyl-phosphate synthase large subunit
MTRVLLTFAGGEQAGGIERGLREATAPPYVIGADANEYFIHHALADELHLLPRADEPDFLESLKSLVKETEPDVLWPLHDDEIELVAGDHGLSGMAFLPSAKTIEICHDKHVSYERFRAAGVAVPETVMLNDRSDIVAALRQFGGEIWVRKIHGAGSAGALRTSSASQAEAWVNVYDGWGEFTASHVLRGQNYCWESVWHDGELIACQSRTRVLNPVTGRPGSSGLARMVHRASAPDRVRETAWAAVLAVAPRPHGIMSVDLNGDDNGVPHVTEINAGRFTASGVTYWRHKGLNFPELTLRLALGQDPGVKAPVIDPMPADEYLAMGRNTEAAHMKHARVEAMRAGLEARRAKAKRQGAA